MRLDFVTIRAYYNIMTLNDLRLLFAGFSISIVTGVLIMIGFFYLYKYVIFPYLETRKGQRFARFLDKQIVHNNEAKSKILEMAKKKSNSLVKGGNPTVGLSSSSALTNGNGDSNINDDEGENKDGSFSSSASNASETSYKRHIPLGAQSALMERAKRLLYSEGKPDKAIVVYLSLLYTAVESKDSSALPAELTDVLRGAAECYKRLGQTENAVKFLQAERRIFEEVVANALYGKKNKESSKVQGGGKSGEELTSKTQTSILQSLLYPERNKDKGSGGNNAKGEENEDKSEAGPRRCAMLSEIAEVCTKLGRHDVALAYTVKAAALKHKTTGKALDEHSPEFLAIAEALSRVQSSPSSSATSEFSTTTSPHSVTLPSKIDSKIPPNTIISSSTSQVAISETSEKNLDDEKKDNKGDQSIIINNDNDLVNVGDGNDNEVMKDSSNGGYSDKINAINDDAENKTEDKNNDKNNDNDNDDKDDKKDIINNNNNDDDNKKNEDICDNEADANIVNLNN